MIYHREFRLSIKWLKRALSKEIPCLNKFYKIYSNTPFIFPLPKKLTLFEGLEIKLTFCLPCKGRWVQLVALGGIVKKRLGHRVQAVFGAFCLLLGGSTLVQLPLAKYKIYLTFSKSTSV